LQRFIPCAVLFIINFLFCCRYSVGEATSALRQTAGTLEAALERLTDQSSSSGNLQFKEVSLTPETISVTILSNTIQLCHFGPLMRFLRRCISMLDHQKSSDAAAVVSVTQKYQEFVPELDKWVHIESNPGLMESARPRQSRAIVEVALPMEQPLLPVNARERPKRRLVPINSVLFNHELPVVTALPSEDQQQPSAPRKRALKFKIYSVQFVSSADESDFLIGGAAAARTCLTFSKF
jgi:hypothetical protein